MAKFPGLFPIVMLLSILPGMSTIARAADAPVATAAIPPPLPAAPTAVAPTTAAPAAPKVKKAIASPAKPSPTAPSAATPTGSKAAGAVASPAKPGSPAKHAVAQKPSRHAKRERHIVVARAYPPPAPPRARYYYPGAPVSDPGSDGPAFPPPWYDRYPGPRGPW